MQQNVMYGLTHNEDGSPIIRESRVLKVGIGIPRGKALRAFIHPTDTATPWYVMAGYYEGKTLKEKSYRFATRAEAEKCYRDLYEKAPDCSYPRKLKYFTFSKPVVNERGGEVYEPDFDAIEACGPTPTRIDILFLNPDAYRGSYQMWSATELRCRGDGINAMRSVSMGDPKDPAVIAAKASGQRYFPILNGCKTRGCEYAERRECKPGCTLNFQLAKNVRIGGTAHFHSTGYESAKEIYSSLHVIQEVVRLATGRTIAGLVARLVMRPYVTRPDGLKAQTQYSVHVELPLQIEKNLQAQLMASVWGDAPKEIAAPAAHVADAEEILAAEEDVEQVEAGPVSAAAMDAEYNDPPAPPDPEWSDPPAPPPPAATATRRKTEGISQTLKDRNKADPARPWDWTSDEAMITAFRDMKARIPREAFMAILANHSVNPGELARGEKSWACYQDLLKMAPAPVLEAVPAVGREELF